MDRPPGVPETFDVRTVVYLRRGEHPPDLDDEASTALQHAHLAHLADLGRPVPGGRGALGRGRGPGRVPERDAPVGERVDYDDL